MAGTVAAMSNLRKIYLMAGVSVEALPGLTLTFFLLLPTIATAQTPSESLRSAWDTALRVDHQVQAAQRNTESADRSIAAARASRFPSITAQATYTALDNTPEAIFQLPLGALGLSTIRQPIANERFVLSNVTVSLPVFTSGQTQAVIQAASAAHNATKGDENRTVLDVKLRVAETYIGVLRTQRALQVAQSNVISLRSLAADVQNAYDEGIVPKNDLLAAQVALADARQREIQASNNLDIARAAYNRLLGRPLTDPLALEEISPEPPVADLQIVTQQALRTRPELAALSEQAEAFRKQASSLRAAQLPQVAVSGGNVFIQNDILVHQSVWSASVGVRWEFFDGGVKRSQAGAFDQKAESLREQRSDALSAVELEVRQAWLETQEADKRIGVTQETLAQAEENLKVSRDRYTEGVGTNTETLDAEALRVRSFSNYYDAMYDAVLARMHLHRAIGDL